MSLSFGLGRYQPHAASEVLANGYGDCKDKNTLLAALLAAQGFESTSVLIGSQHVLDPDIPSPSQFDHVITRVTLTDRMMWIDSTNGVAPFQHARRFLCVTKRRWPLLPAERRPGKHSRRSAV